MSTVRRRAASRVITALALAALAVVLDPSGASALTARTPAFTGATPTVPAPKAGGTAAPSFTLGKGYDPHTVVDDAGTSYVVWSDQDFSGILSPNPEHEGGIGFCRLPRGATSCANPASTRLLFPGRTDYAGGDDAAGNNQGSAYPLILGDQLYIVSSRGSVYQTSGGPSNATVIAFSSDNAGDSFSPAAVLAQNLVLTTAPVAFGNASDPLIALMGEDTGGTYPEDSNCGRVRLAVVAGGAFTKSTDMITLPDARAIGLLNGGDFGVLAPLSGGGVAVGYRSCERGQPGAVLRSNGSSRPASLADFAPAQPVSNGGTTSFSGFSGLANGPQGLVTSVFSLKTVPNDELPPPSQISIAPLAGGGSSTMLPPGVVGGRLASAGGAPGGRLITSYVQKKESGTNSGAIPSAYVRSGTADGAFGPPVLLGSGPVGGNIYGVDVAAAPDGGGGAVWRQVDRTGLGELHFGAIGTAAKSALPGLPGAVPGGGAGPVVTKSCQKIGVGTLAVTLAEGCFISGTGAFAGTSASNGPILYNGVKITPLNNGQIVIAFNAATKGVRLYSTKGARVAIPFPASKLRAGSDAPADIPVFEGDLMQDLTAGEGQPILDLSPKPGQQPYPTTILGFKVKNEIAPTAEGAGSKIEVDLDLGEQFYGLTAHATLHLTPTGLRLDSLHGHAASLPVGGVIVKDLDFSWIREGNKWAGMATILLPGGAALDVDARFDSTSFSANARYTPMFPGIFLFPPYVYLHEIAGGIGLNDPKGTNLQIRAGVKIGAVPLLPGKSLFGFRDIYVLDLNASPPEHGISLTFGSPFVFKASGELNLFSYLTLANGSFEFRSTGYTRFAGNFELGIDPVLFIGGHADFAVSGQGFSSETKVRACGLGICGGAETILSSKGTAACLRNVPIPQFDVPPVRIADVSVTYDFASKDLDSHESCNFDPLRVAVRRQAGAVADGAVQVPAGASSLTLNVHGVDGAPDVDVINPAGAAVGPVSYTRVGQTGSTVIMVNKPAAGRWTVVPRAGSPAIRSVKGDVPKPNPKITARISRPKPGGTRTLSYAVSGDPDATVSFVDRTPEGDQLLTGGGKGTGTLRFTPNPLQAGRHEIRATLTGVSGAPIGAQAVASYVQPPPPKPRAPRRVTAVQRGRSLLVSATRATRGTGSRLLVSVRYGEGGSDYAIIPAGKRTATVRAPQKSLDNPGPTKVSVAGISADGKRGPAKLVVLKGVALQRPGSSTIADGKRATLTTNGAKLVLQVPLCVSPGEAFPVSLTATRKGPSFVKVTRVVFAIGGKTLGSTARAPFGKRLRVPFTTASRTPAITARATLKLRGGRSITRTVRTTLKACA